MRPTNESSIGDVIKEMLRKNDLENGLWNTKISEAWGKTIAKPILQRTLKIKFLEGNLFVTLNSSVLRNELELMKDEIIKSLNMELKEEVVRDIKFY